MLFLPVSLYKAVKMNLHFKFLDLYLCGKKTIKCDTDVNGLNPAELDVIIAVFYCLFCSVLLHIQYKTVQKRYRPILRMCVLRETIKA